MAVTGISHLPPKAFLPTIHHPFLVHRFQTQSMIRRFRFVSLLIFVELITAAISLATILYSIVLHERELTILGLEMLLATVIIAVIKWVLAAKTRCPLCLTPVLARKACSKNRNARRLFGSYRIRAATDILLKGHFRCTYCNEPSILKVRHKH